MLTINGQNTTRLRLKVGEVKLFVFKYNIDIQNARFTFAIKNDKDNKTADVLIEDSLFDKTEINNKIVKCIINTTNLKENEVYFGEMKTEWIKDGTVIVDKTEDIVIEIMQAVTS